MQRHFGKTLIRLTRQPTGRNLLDFCLATTATRSSVLLSTHLDRVIVITPHLSLSALPHNTSPSKRRTLLAVSMAIELSYEAAASTNTQRTPCFRCFLQDVRLTSIREERIIWLSKFLRAIPVLHLAPDESNAAVQRIELLYTGWLLPFHHQG